MNDESHSSPLGISAVLLAVFLALILNQGYGMVQGFKGHSAMSTAIKEATDYQEKLKPLMADLDKNKAAVEADQKMAVDLTALIVRMAQDKNPTALKLVSALQQDLQSLGLSIQLQPNQVNQPGASPSPAK